MVEHRKISRYRRTLETLAREEEQPSAARDELQGEAAKLGGEIHDEERRGKPRALTEDSAVPYRRRRPPARQS